MFVISSHSSALPTYGDARFRHLQTNNARVQSYCRCAKGGIVPYNTCNAEIKRTSNASEHGKRVGIIRCIVNTKRWLRHVVIFFFIGSESTPDREGREGVIPFQYQSCGFDFSLGCARLSDAQ